MTKSQHHSVIWLYTMGIARQRCFVTTLLIFLMFVPTVVPELYEEDPDLPYLYDENAGVVIEYMPSASTQNPLRPDFLYSTNNGPRIVEFYAPWCPHCQNFRDHFVDLSAQMTEASLSVGVDLKVYAISCQVHKTLCRNWELTNFPQIRLFKAGETNNTGKSVYYNLKPNSVLKHLKIPAVVDVVKIKEERKQQKIRAPKAAVGSYIRTPVAVLNDAHLSFLFALRNGLYMADGPLPIKARMAFESWLNLLHRAIPPNSSLHAVVNALLADFKSITEDEAALKEVLRKFPPPKKKWSMGCTHGKKGAGYTCGLWNLFHIVTVGVTEWNQLSLPDLSMTIGVEDAAVTIRNFVENFFGCDVCRKNFMAAFDTCAHDRCTRLNNSATSMSEWREFPLWLFETHNSVNARLLREEGEREEFYPTPKDEMNERWPPESNCLKCWRDDGGSVKDLMTEKLKLEYWPKHSAWLMAKQRAFFNEMKFEVERAQRLLLPVTIQEVEVKKQEDNANQARVEVSNETGKEIDGYEENAANSEESRVDVQNETEEKIDGNEEREIKSEESRVDVQYETEERINGDEEKGVHLEEARSDVQNETTDGMDDDVSRKDTFYYTKEDGSTASVELFLLCFIAVIVGLVVTWYLNKVQRKRSGLHKKLDVAAVYRAELSYC